MCKRAFDIFFSFLGLLILSVIFIFIAIFIAIDSKGGVFFVQVRVGRSGKEFKILKFRTMVVNNSDVQITVGEDKRITRIGKFLRKTKLDELPQLINVFKGDMSFVGPRPEVPKYVALYNEKQRKILAVRPGITDVASIKYRNESEILANSKNPEQTYINEIMPEKLELNMAYIENMSVLYDIKLIFQTFYVIIRK